MQESERKFCEIEVERHDRDRYRLGLCYPAVAREALWPLFAFNYEIAKTREVVSEPTIGLIRLQWWREAIEALYEEGRSAPGHEIVQALAPLIARHHLPRAAFEELLNAREADLDAAGPESLADLLVYARGTAQPLNRLVLAVLGEEEEDGALTDVSVAYALTGLLRALPFHAAQGRYVLPSAISQEEDAIRQVAATAEELLARVRPRARFMRLSAALSRLYLRRLRGLGYDVYNPRLNAPPWVFMLKMLFLKG